MGNVPDANAANDAVHALTQSLRAALRAGPPLNSARDPARQVALARLAGDLARLNDQTHWCRDAALALARRDLHPAGRASWGLLQQETGIADATLIERLHTWHRRETP